MKKLTVIILALLFTAGLSTAGTQDYPDEYLGLPGDNLNLYAVMKLFRESKTLEDFERDLNSEESRINNLDLNGDNYVDYLMVMDYQDGNVHTIVLRAALGRNETQDVAVFTVQQFNNGSVQVQLVGDEALYGPNYIVEPVYADQSVTPNPGYMGKNPVTVVHTTTYEVAAWPVVRFIFMPSYVVWRSSWYWGYYPTYWDPWSPFYWHTYYGYHSHWHHHYYAHYRHCDYYRYPGYRDYYYHRVRNYSPTVIVNINKNYYHDTYSRPDLRKQGDRLYASTHSGRNTSGLRSSRDGSGRSAGTNIVRNDGSARSKSGSAVRSSRDGSSSRSSGLKSGDRSSVSRRSSGESSEKSGVLRSGTRSSTNSDRPVVRSSSSESRSSVRSSSSANRPSVRSSAGRENSSARMKEGTVTRSPSQATQQRTTVRQPQTKSGAVYSRPSSRSSERATSSPSVRQSTQSRSHSTISRNSSSGNRPSVKSAPMQSPSRSSRPAVSSSRSSERSTPSVSSSSGSSHRSSPSVRSSSGSSHRSSPSVRSSSPQRSQPATRSSSRSSSSERSGRR